MHRCPLLRMLEAEAAVPTINPVCPVYDDDDDDDGCAELFSPNPAATAPRIIISTQ